MAATGFRARATALVAAGVIVLAGCTSERVLPSDPAGAEPGYPQYSAPTGELPGGPDAAPTAGADEPTGTSPSADTPSPSEPVAEPTLAPSPTPPPVEPGAEPSTPAATSPSVPPAPPAPSASAPVTPPPTSAPPAPAPSTPPRPTPVTLATQTWQPRCGAALTAPAAVNDLSVAIDGLAAEVHPSSTPPGGQLQTEAVLTNLVDAPLAAERYAASVTIARHGTVVSTWVEGQDAGPAISVAARGTLVVPVFHDLVETCSSLGSVAPEPPPSDAALLAPAAAAAVSGATSADALAVARTATPSASPASLTAGEYTAVVAIHLVRDGAQAGTVVATSGVVPLTITASSNR